ncbi:MAG: sigma-54 dependent transcriptional regulator [Gammaproteobacteria bacterium]|nr:sigma-54 dependent transcriptional regulator [Gammaproteobacteria bacterium]MBU2056899.1 sigma-54 dependent transcriptional regulator [Gammaproteobacteria bacterium]MBU2174569.1 sigma-54 dependent transcriptional regulator [Gammaproteobacteria bacterium]MBU2248261.1 sigma-54 dependent transcriptional regulator [Gammaproteobacteria bacterium]MBU2343734.1 sigma-54 dependent transcriptional regulator [Gammaproteobacteria bacterium]
MKQPFSVLVLDDNHDILIASRIFLKQYFTFVATLHEPAQLISTLESQRFDLLLLDMNFSRDTQSGEEGLFYLKQALKAQPDLKVVMMTAYAALPLAVSSMQIGAANFIAKPWQNEQLLQALQQALQYSPVKLTAKEQSIIAPDSIPLLGDSSAMQQVVRTIEKVGATDANVLLLGESGTGKALVARAIHQASKRALAPFISVDMGSLSTNLLESELFGHKKGAFTDAKSDYAGRFIQASGGSLLLDELANLALPQQAKLLAALQNRTVVPVGASQPIAVDIRLICATNENLHQLVVQGKFRQDLLYRINTVEIVLPPLRERVDDIPLLLDWYLQYYAQRYQRDGLRINITDKRYLQQYDWPGNVRQLAHAVERAVVLAEGNILDFSQLHTETLTTATTVVQNADTEYFLDFVEKKTICQALQYYQGNVSQAAKALGLTRGALYRRLEKYGL